MRLRDLVPGDLVMVDPGYMPDCTCMTSELGNVSDLNPIKHRVFRGTLGLVLALAQVQVSVHYRTEEREEAMVLFTGDRLGWVESTALVTVP